ncbi:MAG: hypothetical protein KY476_02635, partial [Planctomycetes bacterium]|nr:hypothetical protein [Planctomycetota bacterium]
PANPEYNPLAALSKTVRFDDNGHFAWGDVPDDAALCAHHSGTMSCTACHSSWNPSCYGCHLPQKADKKMPELHNEGDVGLNYTAYNWQTLRSEVYMLARDGIVTGQKINPVRSACAIHVGSYNKNRESIYYQQQTISAEGLSGIAFSTNVPHTVRGKGETKTCTDCHLSRDNDNNALIAQLLMHGTNFTNLIGKYCWVACADHGLFAVQVTETAEPQTVIGSYLHKLSFPDDYRKHVEHGRQYELFHEHPGNDISQPLLNPFRKPEVLACQLRGEYVYAACGKAGFRIFDVAFTDHKGFSERMVTAPVSPVGQRFYVRTKYCTDVAAPTTIAPDPTRTHLPENREQPVHAMYAYIYVTDKYEGLIMVGAGTLLDGNPLNNFVKKDVVFNPDGILNGARSIEIVGTNAYICCDVGLVVVSIENPKEPQITEIIDSEILTHPTDVAVQFRYGFVCDHEGIKVLDTTDPAHPKYLTKIELHEAHKIYVARTYGYVAAGSQGLVILDLKDPAHPKIDQIYNAGGKICELHDVKLGITYTSEFAYLADGHNGLHVVQLTSPDTPGYAGFSPRPTPRLVGTFKIPKGGHAVAISEGIDRDRAVDEAGNQIAVFGRVGARPLNLEEQRRLYLQGGDIWTVADPKRDYSIPEAPAREAALRKAIEDLYGPGRHPAREQIAQPLEAPGKATLRQ